MDLWSSGAFEELDGFEDAGEAANRVRGGGEQGSHQPIADGRDLSAEELQAARAVQQACRDCDLPAVERALCRLWGRRGLDDRLGQRRRQIDADLDEQERVLQEKRESSCSSSSGSGAGADVVEGLILERWAPDHDSDLWKVVNWTSWERNLVQCTHLCARHGGDKEEKGAELLEFILDCGGNPLALSGDDNTPAHFAAFNGATGALRLLVERFGEAVVAHENDMGKLPLHKAAKKGQAEAVFFLTQELPSCAGHEERKNIDGKTAAQVAADAGAVEVAQVLQQAKGGRTKGANTRG